MHFHEIARYFLISIILFRSEIIKKNVIWVPISIIIQILEQYKIFLNWIFSFTLVLLHQVNSPLASVSWTTKWFTFYISLSSLNFPVNRFNNNWPSCGIHNVPLISPTHWIRRSWYNYFCCICYFPLVFSFHVYISTCNWNCFFWDRWNKITCFKVVHSKRNPLFYFLVIEILDNNIFNIISSSSSFFGKWNVNFVIYVFFLFISLINLLKAKIYIISPEF